MPDPTPSIHRLVLHNAALIGGAFLVAVVAAAVALTVTLDAVHDTEQETVEELHPVHQLQMALAGFDQHIHHYLLDPTPQRLREISRGRSAVDRAFRSITSAPFGAPHERKAVMAAKRAWDATRQETETILSRGKQSQGETALAAMERVMVLLDRALSGLDEAYGLAYQELAAHHRRADTATHHGLLVIGLVALFGVATVAYAVLSIHARVLRPLRGLARAARALGRGHLEQRAEVGAQDELGHLAETFNEMAARLQAHRDALTERATHDALTGLYNREALFQRLGEESARALRHGRPLSVALFDLDCFKGVNDGHGHATGDQVLEAFATVLQGTLRRGDVAARYGGEEFVLVYPETDAAAARLAAERIRGAFAETAVTLATGEPLTVTVSAGVACSLPTEPLPLQQLLEHADRALYAAKAAGRNRVEAA